MHARFLHHIKTDNKPKAYFLRQFLPKNHISNTKNTQLLESKNRKSSYQNRNIEIKITEAEIRIEAKRLSRKIVTAPHHSDNT